MKCFQRSSGLDTNCKQNILLAEFLNIDDHKGAMKDNNKRYDCKMSMLCRILGVPRRDHMQHEET